MSSESLRYGRLREAARLLAECPEVTETSINDYNDEIEVRTAIPNQLWGLPSSIHGVLKNERHLELRDFQGSKNGETMRLWVVVHMDEETEAGR